MNAHRISGPVITALCIGCGIGVLADWRLRETGPPTPVEPAQPVLTSSAPKEALPIRVAATTRAESPEEELANRNLRFPIDRMDVELLKGGFEERRSGGARPHEAVDILAPRFTPVYAVESGTIAKLFFSKAGGITVYQFDPTGRFCYYYAHLERYAPGLQDGETVERGQVIGYVGTSGNAPPGTPHLHFAVFELGSDQRWWRGHAIDPYAILRR